MSDRALSPEVFNQSLRTWVKGVTGLRFGAFAAHLFTSPSTAYRRTQGEALMTRGELEKVVAAAVPETESDREAWVRRETSFWLECWEQAKRVEMARRGAPASRDVPEVPDVSAVTPAVAEVTPAAAAAVAAAAPAVSAPVSRPSVPVERVGPPIADGATSGDAPTIGEDLHEACDRLGVAGFFVPLPQESGTAPGSTNHRRNEHKLRLLRSAAASRDTVCLLAETGNSYLHVRGPFNTAVNELLAGGGTFQVVLMSPGEHLRGEQDELRLKFRQSLRGFTELQRTYGDRVDLRVLRARMTSTLLISSEGSFFEPYLHVDSDERERLLLNTFELEFPATARLHQTLIGNFLLHYRQAESPDRWLPA